MRCYDEDAHEERNYWPSHTGSVEYDCHTSLAENSEVEGQHSSIASGSKELAVIGAGQPRSRDATAELPISKARAHGSAAMADRQADWKENQGTLSRVTGKLGEWRVSEGSLGCY